MFVCLKEESEDCQVSELFSVVLCVAQLNQQTSVSSSISELWSVGLVCVSVIFACFFLSGGYWLVCIMARFLWSSPAIVPNTLLCNRA